MKYLYRPPLPVAAIIRIIQGRIAVTIVAALVKVAALVMVAVVKIERIVFTSILFIIFCMARVFVNDLPGRINGKE